MPLTPEQLAAGRAAMASLQRAEAAHPDSALLKRHHRELANLRDAFRSEMSEADYAEFGGGTPKTDDSGSGG